MKLEDATAAESLNSFVIASQDLFCDLRLEMSSEGTVKRFAQDPKC